MSNFVLSEEKAGICILTLNRPDSFNALDQVLIDELRDKIELCSASSNTRVLIITGSGKGFCAGGDLKKIYDSLPVAPSKTLAQMTRSLHCLISDLRRMRQPVIAAINGITAGAGFSLALACDLRVASEKAKFRQAYTSSGLVPDAGWTAFAPAILGQARALQMVMLDPVINAQAALEWGVVHAVCAEDQVLKAATEWAEKLTKGASFALGQAKMLLNRSVLANLERQLEDERRSMVLAADSQEGLEGIHAFVEKRPPVFIK